MIMDDKIDALLDAAGDENPLLIHARINERRRKRAHNKAKAEQPELGLRQQHSLPAMSEVHHAAQRACDILKAEFRKPTTQDERDHSGMDQLLFTVQECLDAGDLEDAVFALVRVARRAWGTCMHMVPIQGIPVTKPGQHIE
jgi:hypothetical protein